MDKKNYLAIFAKSFNWAGFFLPKKIYEDSAKLYAFCRILDDTADEKTDLDSKVKRFDRSQFSRPNKKMFTFDYLKKMKNSLEPIVLSKYPKLKS